MMQNYNWKLRYIEICRIIRIKLQPKIIMTFSYTQIQEIVKQALTTFPYLHFFQYPPPMHIFFNTQRATQELFQHILSMTHLQYTFFTGHLPQYVCVFFFAVPYSIFLACLCCSMVTSYASISVAMSFSQSCYKILRFRFISMEVFWCPLSNPQFITRSTSCVSFFCALLVQPNITNATMSCIVVCKIALSCRSRSQVRG